jgi:superfamily I DNA/RNA helicase
VGDDAQSIYGFRGSKIELILNFERYYPKVKEIVLDQNYRSTQNILDLAEKVLTHSKKQKPKNLKASGINGQSDVRVKHYRANNEKEEAEFVIAQIATLVEQTLVEQNKQGSEKQKSNFEKPKNTSNLGTNLGTFNGYVPNTDESDSLASDTDSSGFLNSKLGHNLNLGTNFSTSSNSEALNSETSKNSSGGGFFDNLFDKYTQDMDSSLPTGIQSSYSWEDSQGRTKMNFNLDSKMHSGFENWEPLSYGARFGFQSYKHIDWKNCEYLNEIAILYRTNSQSRSIEEAFIKHKIPYKLASGVRFLDRKEVKDVLSILKFVASSEDKISLKRFLPLLVSGIGDKTLEKILAFLEDPDYPLAPKHQSQVYEILEIIQTVWQDSSTLRELTENLLEKLGYWEYLKKEYPDKEERQARIDNIKELYSIMLEFDEEDMEYQNNLSQTDLAKNEPLEIDLDLKLQGSESQYLKSGGLEISSRGSENNIKNSGEKESFQEVADFSKVSAGFDTLQNLKKAKLKPASEILFGDFETMSTSPLGNKSENNLEKTLGYSENKEDRAILNASSNSLGLNTSDSSVSNTLPKKPRKEMDQKLTTFLNSVMLMSSQEQSDNQYKVTLMTLHQSKGLEFETVFLVGIEDGILPHINSFYEEGGMDEEVRLSYVGVTRAKKNLFLTSALSRILFGRVESYPVSRIFRPFLKDL